MRRYWALGTLVAFIVAAGSLVAARQTATKPATAKPVVKKEAKTEKEDDEQEENAGAKKYKIAVQLPAAITTAFKNAYPNATIRGTAKETEGGKTVYEVESIENGKAHDFIYSADGTVMEIEEELNPADLPAPVAAGVKKLYPTATIAVAEKLTRGTMIQYELQLKGAAKKSVSLMPDGKPVPPAPVKK
jgi:uncharacterized cupredoxin-like copper-binding protein